MKETVLVLGARGRFGLATARAFADAGWRVLAHMRVGGSVPNGARGDSRIEWLAMDLHDATALSRAAEGATVVVHALNPPYTLKDWKAQVLPMTDAALDIARRLNATLMMPGNVYNFGEDMPAESHEDTPQLARTIKGQIRIGMEAQLQRSGVRSVVIRAGDFFGSGTGTWFDQVIAKDLTKGRFTYPGELNIQTAWAYLPDLARTFVQVADKRAQLHRFEVLHFKGHSLTGQDWLNVLNPIARASGWVRSDAAGSGLSFRQLPWTFIRLGAWLVPTWASLMEMRYLWTTPHSLNNNRLTALLGAEPYTPLERAAQESLKYLTPKQVHPDKAMFPDNSLREST